MSGMVVYSSPFVPAEWIAAHGLQPRRLLPSGHGKPSGVSPAVGVCPFAQAFANTCLAEDDIRAVIITTTCDQMRRMAETVSPKRPVFLMNVPHTHHSANALRLFRDELERMGQFLIEMGGQEPRRPDLVRIMLEHERSRTARTSVPIDGPGARLALLGGPLMDEHFEILDIIERAGGVVVLDATEGGERTLPAAYDQTRMESDPLAEMTRAYFGSIPDAFRRPNDDLYAWLRKQTASRKVQGIIFIRYVWCDTWHAELARVREKVDLPILDLDLAADGAGSSGRITGRLQAFTEMLR